MQAQHRNQRVIDGLMQDVAKAQGELHSVASALDALVSS